jgi:tetratricopeptide (TPR) repeat protein
MRFLRPHGSMAGLVAAALLAFTACQPTGERALVEGDRRLRTGDVSGAIALLERAVQTLPQDARAWHHLGLAYQSAGRPDDARRAYLRALNANRDFFDAHHNLAVVYAERGDWLEAERSLRAYLAARPEDGPAWTRLGTVLFQSGQFDAAERALSTAQRLQAADADAWNTLGLISVQKRKYRDAQQRFQWALKLSTNHAPAQLNLAIVLQQHLGDRRSALTHYRAFLAVSPDAPEAGSVRELVRSLEQPPTTPIASMTTNQIALRTNGPPRTPIVTATPTPAPMRTNALPAAAPFRSLVENPSVVAPTIPTTTAQIPAARPAEPKPLPPPEVVRVEDEPPPQAARDAAPLITPPPSAPVSSRVETPQVRPSDTPSTPLIADPTGPTATPETPRRTVWQRVNPVNWGNPVKWFRRSDKPVTRLDTNAERPRVIVNDPPARPAVALQPPPVIAPPRAVPAPAPKPIVPRYVPQASGVALAPGNRAACEAEFNQAAGAHQRRDLTAAMAGYRRATELDPAYFEAHHNLALAALDQGDTRLALLASEHALSLRPADESSRRNFILALRRGGYPADAAEQMEQLLAVRPSDAGLHLVTAGLFAGELQDPDRARPHYERVLVLDPNHPQAGNIRAWLQSNPR